jgi:hypothetical protein
MVTADFFRRTDGHTRYCILGLDIGTREPTVVASAVRTVLLQAPFSSRAERAGRVIRASRHQAWAYYRRSDVEWTHVVFATREVSQTARPDLRPEA